MKTTPLLKVFSENMGFRFYVAVIFCITTFYVIKVDNNGALIILIIHYCYCVLHVSMPSFADKFICKRYLSTTDGDNYSEIIG